VKEVNLLVMNQITIKFLADGECFFFDQHIQIQKRIFKNYQNLFLFNSSSIEIEFQNQINPICSTLHFFDYKEKNN
jgi:hypothetical protein